MPAAYYVYARRRVAIISWESGLPDLPAWQAVFDALIADPAFGEGFGVVSDWRTAVEPPTAEFVHGAVEYAKSVRRSATLRWASVLPPQAAMIDAGLVAQWLASTVGLDYRSFTDYRAAIAWAGRSEEPEATPAG
jgi:hypothetical protein